MPRHAVPIAIFFVTIVGALKFVHQWPLLHLFVPLTKRKREKCSHPWIPCPLFSSMYSLQSVSNWSNDKNSIVATHMTSLFRAGLQKVRDCKCIFPAAREHFARLLISVIANEMPKNPAYHIPPTTCRPCRHSFTTKVGIDNQYITHIVDIEGSS
jgi:hypothetical protein